MKSYLFLIFALLIKVLFVKSKRNMEPYFTNSWNWQIEENSPVGSRPRSSTSLRGNVILTAYDPNGDSLKYSVEDGPGTGYFSVDSETGVVKLMKTFDREIVNSTVARFSVSDHTSKAIGTAHVDVLDVNDNAPLFERFHYDVTIREDSPVGFEVLRAVAVDPDVGAGGEVHHRIDETSPTPFRIDPYTGVVSLRESIDYERTNSYRLVVSATDQDPINPLSSFAMITIHVADVQDTPPIFMNLPYDTSIDENIALRTKILRVLAIDGDREHPNKVVYSLLSGDESGKLLLDASSGEIFVAKRIDRDELNFSGVFHLKIRATELVSQQNVGIRTFSDVSFNITVNDLNDERPVFDLRLYKVTLPESTPIGTPLPQRIHISDSDQGINSDVTVSVEWGHRDTIIVSPVTFRSEGDVTIILIKALDFEKKRKLSFKIFANESTNLQQYTYCDVTIFVTNENDNTPVFDLPHYVVEVPENTPTSSTILRVSASDADLGKFGKVVYLLETESEELEIDPRTGDIRILQELDYEHARMKQYILIACDSAPQPLRGKSLLTVTVGDVNDNSPMFPRRFPDVFIKENTKQKNISEIKATDSDSYPHNIIHFAINGGHFSQLFSINANNNGVAMINLEESLDFESIPGGSITLSITAFDSGLLSTTAPLVVNVVDENDNPPVFVAINNFSVEENIGGGSLVGRVRAEDRDSGENSEVSYYVTKGRELFDTIFEMDEQTGEITTKPGTSPDYERSPIFYIEVTATDHGNPMLSTSQKIKITVKDVNDNLPVFEHAIYRVVGEENSEQFDIRVHAEDSDSGRNGRIRYTIVEGNNADVFEIDDVTGDVSTARAIDYEAIGPEVILKIKAEDEGNVSLSSFTQIVVTIVDVNDNAPRFTRAPEIIEVMENVVGPPLGTFAAEDADAGDNAAITFSIIRGNDAGLFSISPLDGELRVSRETFLDREEDRTHELVVCAADSGVNSLQTQVRVHIRVLGVNDNAPVFTNLPARIVVDENVVKRNLFRVRAVDSDEEDHGRIRYSIEEESKHFHVHPKRGVISIIKALDREEKHEHILHIRATDNPTDEKNSRSSKKSLLVVVNDVNDEKPQFNGPSPYRAFVSEEAPPMTLINYWSHPISANDADEGRFAEVTYQMEDSPYFDIVQSNGRIRTAVKIDLETLPLDVINLTVRAVDVGGLYSETVVMVTINDINDNSPRFKRNPVKKRVLESVEHGHVIARMAATDRDCDMNGRVSYAIERGSRDTFMIDSNTGGIYLTPGHKLDREMRSKYRLKIIASDHGLEGTRSSTGTVVIIIDDVNDTRPKFTSLEQEVEIRENSRVGTTVAEISAIDEDLNHHLSFFITSVTIYGVDERPLMVESSVSGSQQSDYDVILQWFNLNSSSGQITLGSSDTQNAFTVDREVCSSVHIHYSVRDLASAYDEVSTPSQGTSVKFNIVDVNDNPPIINVLSIHVIISSDEVIVDVDEEVDQESVVMELETYDVDQSINGQVTLEIADLIGDLVSLKNVDETKGVIFAKSRIDRESLAPSGGSGWINFTIVARDQGFPLQQSSKLRVNLRVNDVNDNSPTFEEDVYEVSVLEDVSIGSKVARVHATDPDDGLYGDVIYSLYGSDGFFHINQTTGDVIVAKPLDRETLRKHVFVVTAKDASKRKVEFQESSVQVTIVVRDVNDNAPKFIEPMTKSIVVSERTSPGSTIAMVTATDADDGEFGHVTYKLQKPSEYISINPHNGNVRTIRPIDASRRHPAINNLTIVATDGGGIESFLVFQIEIADVNDHAPQFIQPASNIIRIPEERSSGYFVTQVTAIDNDLGLNGAVRYKLSDSSTERKFFYIDQLNGRLVTAQRLDRELQQTYILVVQASDLGSPPQRTNKILTVVLDDINDNKPNFPQNDRNGAFQSFTISEDAGVGTFVGHVTRAIDRDETADIYYYILSEDGASEPSTFTIENDEIVLQRKLNREKQSRYALLVRATNDYPLPLSPKHWADSIPGSTSEPPQQWDPSRDPTLLRLYITVDDVIDDPPAFIRNSYVTAVEADIPIGADVFQVEATDGDIDDILTYSTVQSTLVRDDRSIRRNDFVINRKTGMITSCNRLSNEDRTRYVLIIQVSDTQNLTDTTRVEIQVVEMSTSLRLIVDSPSHLVESHKEDLLGFLENTTGSVVKFDDVGSHVDSDGLYDVTRSDVRIRLFTSESSRNRALEKLRGGKAKLKEIMTRFSLHEDIVGSNQQRLADSQIGTETNYFPDVTILRILTIILSAFLLLFTLSFIVAFCHMRRKYKNEIDRLRKLYGNEQNATPSGNNLTTTSIKKKENLDRSFQNSTVKANTFRPMEASDLEPANPLLWSPSLPKRSSQENRYLAVGNREDVFEPDIGLHADSNHPANPTLHRSNSLASP